MIALSQLKLIGYAITGFVIAALIVALAVEKRHSRKLQGQLSQCVELRKIDRANFEAAAKRAQAENLADIARIKGEQQRITANVQSDYNRDLSRLRAELASRLRAKASTDPGISGQAGIPAVPGAPAGVDGAPRVSIPASLYVRGAELELQLERLQLWIVEQMRARPQE